MPQRRKFIDKKKAITFQLVHRSQHDPLIADDTAGEHVLVPLNTDKRKAEQLKYGIEYDDDYDYLQHLRDPCAPPEEYSVHVDKKTNEIEEEDDDDDDEYEDEDEDEDEDDDKDNDHLMSRFNLPSTVFESKTTNEIGMLNLAAPDSDPKIHWDPDVIAALDDDEYDYEDGENTLDDDFMLKANGIQPLDENECDEFEDEIAQENLPTTIPPLFVPKTNKPIPLALRRFLNDDDDDDHDADMESNYSHNDDDRQTSKTKYTNYSMTSSVIRRNQGLQNIDDHFDKVFDEYDDEEIGALDSQQINQEGASIEDDLVKQTIQHFEKQQMQTDEKIEQIAIEKTKRLARRLLNEPEAVTTLTLQDDEKADDKWDCQSILSTYSNLYNHPKLITQIPTNRIRLSRKTGLPLADNNKISIKEQRNTNQEEEEDEEDDDDDDEEDNNTKSMIFERKKGETSEERRARKHAVKEIRKDRRIIKKATKIAFKQEEQKQLHEQALHSTQAHLQSLRVT
ncbi:hypothetical protein I4U23_021636 [Adineta vaga]|nr:hypothetical protein I4U23_021636 [Adineta vaga]